MTIIPIQWGSQVTKEKHRSEELTPYEKETTLTSQTHTSNFSTVKKINIPYRSPRLLFFSSKIFLANPQNSPILKSYLSPAKSYAQNSARQLPNHALRCS